MSFVGVQIDGVLGQRRIQRIAAAIRPDIFLKLIGARLLSYVDESFKTKGRGRWKQLSGLTVLLRSHGGDQPLQDTGRYKQSFVSESGGPGTDFATDNQTFVEVGTNVKTASGLSLGKIHEFGTGPYTIRVKRAKVLAAKTRAGSWLFFGKEVRHPGIPARPVLPTVPVAEQLVLDVAKGVIERAKQLGGN